MSLLEDVRREVFSAYQTTRDGDCVDPRILLHWWDMLDRYIDPPDPTLTRAEVKVHNARVLRYAEDGQAELRRRLRLGP